MRASVTSILLCIFVSTGASLIPVVDANHALRKPAQTLVNFRKNDAVTTSSISETVLIVPRGGRAGVALLQPAVAAKTFLVLYGLNVAQAAIFPQAHAAMYSISKDPLTLYIIKELGAEGCSIVLMMFLQFFQGLPFEKAVGWSRLPYMAHVASQMVTGEFSKVGVPMRSGYLALYVNGVLAYNTLWRGGGSVANNSLKVYSVWLLVNTLGMFFLPEKLSQIWGAELQNGRNKLVWGILGSYIATDFMFIASQAIFGMADINQVLGWSILSLDVYLIGLIAKGNFKEGNVPMIPALIWSVLLSGLAQSLILGGGTIV